MDECLPADPPAGVTPLPLAVTTPPRNIVVRSPSVRSRAISRALRVSLHPFLHYVPDHPVSIRTVRCAVDTAARFLPGDRRVRIKPLDKPVPARPVVGEWVMPRKATGGDGVILYLHGGGYVVCSPRTHRPITSRLAVECGLPVLVPRYRLAPEHPFPAALEDALDAYRWLLSSSFPGDRIVIAGDSAGGHLAASLTAEILRTGLPGPAGVVLYSPWVDLSCEMSTRCDTPDPYISASIVRRVGRRVVGSADLADPRLALLGRSWAGMPPFLIQVGAAEILRPEAERLARMLIEADVACEFQVWPGQMHVFQILDRVVPEAGEALHDTARFVRSVLANAAASTEAVA